MYHQIVLEPNTCYPIPASMHYILMTIQKTVFDTHVMPETVLPTLLQNSFHLGDFRKTKDYHQKAYKLLPRTPAHPPADERPTNTCLDKRHTSLPMTKNPFEVPSRYKKYGSPRPRDEFRDPFPT
ncbi:hypothetical protein NPIL_379321 [Nephila pilipes]|uniref:Uncharacterized protein n=1 Tax=Nephila pilipes TaxID=299642 RepID=A0A8X6MZD8_NEPPI|nr:hypothetical protein NPIL_379321 [Nephila pilipes]